MIIFYEGWVIILSHFLDPSRFLQFSSVLNCTIPGLFYMYSREYLFRDIWEDFGYHPQSVYSSCGMKVKNKKNLRRRLFKRKGSSYACPIPSRHQSLTANPVLQSPLAGMGAVPVRHLHPSAGTLPLTQFFSSIMNPPDDINFANIEVHLLFLFLFWGFLLPHWSSLFREYSYNHLSVWI